MFAANDVNIEVSGPMTISTCYIVTLDRFWHLLLVSYLAGNKNVGADSLNSDN